MKALPLMESALLEIAPRLEEKIAQPLIPVRPLEAGEQYRFHFDMSKCIGCKCCVVACNEQNGNPAAINWRTVGEVEGGYYPHTQRYHLSMGCNQCLEPSCLIGCPVEAYAKDPKTGVVLHDADICIGCQYCTWNCSYGVPQYNPERGVVGKCDLCHNRLSDGMPPACVAACPETALSIEIVNISEWRRDYLSANAPGLPSAADSISTTRVTLPRNLLPDVGRVDTDRLEPERPHWPLVFMLVLTQLSVGAFSVLWLLDMLRECAGLMSAALASLALAGVSIAASILHVGRPAHIARALKALRSSWLSREVLTLSLFAAGAAVYSAMLFADFGARAAVGSFTALAGLAGLFCSARIYIVRARPAWFSGFTIAEFFSSTLLLGPLFVNTFLGHSFLWIKLAFAAGAASQLVTQTVKFLWLSQSDVFELRASSLLLSGRLRNLFLLRMGILVSMGIFLPLGAGSAARAGAVFALALLGEWLGRYLFFVSVVPKSVAAAFTSGERKAA